MHHVSMCVSILCIDTMYCCVMDTVHVIYLVNNKFGELGHNAHWCRFQFGEQGDIECTLFIIHVIISSVGVH